MRTLTIQREKSFVGSLGSPTVYIEDPVSPETTVTGIPCRKLGKLKNGEEISFQIPENAARLLVVTDKLSASYSSACIQLPEGTADLHYTGKNRFNPTRGNAFCFNDVEELPGTTKKKTGIGILVLVAALIFGGVLGWLISTGALSREEDKVFEKEDFRITLTDAFSERDDKGGFRYGFQAKKAAVLVSSEPLSGIPDAEHITEQDYAELLVQFSTVSPKPEIRTENGLVFLEYTTEVEERPTCYLVPVYKSADAFWVVNFACTEVLYEKLRPDFLKWASTVEFP